MSYEAYPESNYGEVVSHELQEPVDREFVHQMCIEAGDWHHRLGCCQIRKVQPQLRLRAGQPIQNVYDPVVVSIGPYHHGKPELRQAEEFKHVCLNWCVRDSKPLKDACYNIILEKINEIRKCYPEDTKAEEHDDRTLAKMILLDACFIINFMEIVTNLSKRGNQSEWFDFLGWAALQFAVCDIELMENQIPFPVLTILMKLMYHGQGYGGEELIEQFLTEVLRNDEIVYEEEEDPPIHLLEARWRTMAKKRNTKSESESDHKVHSQFTSKFQWPKFLTRTKKKDEKSTEMETEQYTVSEIQKACSSRSVMDLKAKGVHFRPSSRNLMDIKFNSHTFYGQLQLPIQLVSNLSSVRLSNMIAFEVSPKGKTSNAVLSHVIFMKSLIQSTEDVQELQEKGILINESANLDHVVRVFREIDTFGLIDFDNIFTEVRMKIENHCRNKAKTWIADLIHTRFKSPWTVIAFLAATFLLCLTFLQTYFTIRPVK